MGSHNLRVSRDSKPHSRKPQLNVCRNNSQVGQTVNPSTPSVTVLGKQNTQPYSTAGYPAMAVHNAGSHPVNISEQKNITAERTLNCFPCLSLWDSILLFWRQGFRWHTASFSTFSTVVTSLPKFRGKKKLNPVKVSLSLRHIPGAGINSGACHVWDIVGVRWKLRKMDGTIKVRVENGVYEFVGDCFFGVAPPFFKQWVEMPLCVGLWAGTSNLTTMSGFFLSVWKR